MGIPHMGSFIRKLPHQIWGEECHQKVTRGGGVFTEKSGVIYKQQYEGKCKHFTF